MDWDAAVLECGGSGTFLLSLLRDLRCSLGSAVATCTIALKCAVDATPQPGWASMVRDAVSTLKGLTASLSCHELNHACVVLEGRAKAAVLCSGGTSDDYAACGDLLMDLQVALANFDAFLEQKAA